jgi:hypothetical protein
LTRFADITGVAGFAFERSVFSAGLRAGEVDFVRCLLAAVVVDDAKLG